MKYHWIIPPNIKDLISKIDYSYNTKLLSILYQRGFQDKESISAFLDTSLKSMIDPFKMLGMEKAVKRILQAIKNNEKILIFGDYDVDGITAITVLMHFFKLLNITPDFHVPHRINEGYGLNEALVSKAHENNISLIITVDTGINNVKEVDKANHLNIDVIITDHHKPQEYLPNAVAILNPNLPNCKYPNKNLAGVGVAFKLVHACLKELPMEKEKSKKFLKELLDFVTLGTIADLAPLIGENRNIVAFGLKQLSESPFPGIRILFNQLGISDKSISTGMVAFKVTPKLNASGRMDHGNFSAQLLMASDPDECIKLFSKLETLNKERQDIEEDNLILAISLVEKELQTNSNFIILKHPKFHAGVNGIIAARLIEKYHLPAIVFAFDNNGFLKGSARSIKGLNIFNCIAECKDLCVSFGGHAYAAGLTIHENDFQKFKKKLYKIADKMFSKNDFEPKIYIDACIDLDEINDDFMNDFKRLEPFGFGNLEPLFLTKNVSVTNTPKILKGKHLKCNIGKGKSIFEAIGFNYFNKENVDLNIKDKLDIVYKIGINNWMGFEKIQIEIVDLKKN